MSSAASINYLGRVAQRRGKHVTVDVLASQEADAWRPLDNPRKIFPKLGQAELAGVAGLNLHPGEWLAFQVTRNTRPGGASYRITNHRVLPYFADLSSLGSLEAARVLFTKTGWDGGSQSGQWIVRFSEDRVLLLTLQLDRAAKRLRVLPNRLSTVPCYEFDGQRVVVPPSNETRLYDLIETHALATHDWSRGADYIAHVIRSLAGADDPRLPELITWLELHREEETGRISATGADHEKAFEALRSGELAARLTADRELMAEYLVAVRNDPAVAKAVADAAADLAKLDKETLLSELRSEAAAEVAAERQRFEDELKAEKNRIREEIVREEESLQEAMRMRLAETERKLEEELEQNFSARTKAAEEDARQKADELAQVVTAIEDDRRLAEADRAELQMQIAQLRGDVAELEAKREMLQGLISDLSSHAQGVQGSSEPGSFVEPPTPSRSEKIGSKELAQAIAGSALLTGAGKSLMRRFLAFMLAGEVPILEGAERDDFVLIAESLVAAGRLLQFDTDATVLTAEDIWSRPGSSLTSVVGRATQIAASDEGTLLVELRGIDRSAARSWYPSLLSYCRKGLLPRRLLIFATVVDASSEEAKALPADVCRLSADSAIVPGAALVAPNILGGGSGSVAFEFDPGPRPGDLSPALPILAELNVQLDVAMSLRVARIALESAVLNPADQREALAAAQDFCRSTKRLTEMRVAEKKSA